MLAVSVSLMFPNALALLALKNPQQELYSPSDSQAMVREKTMEYCYRLTNSIHDRFQIFGNLDLLVAKGVKPPV